MKMRWLTTITVLLALSACGPAPAATTAPAAAPTSAAAPASTPAPTKGAPATAANTPAPTAKPAATAAAAASAEGIRVTLDGKAFDLTGETKVSREKVSGLTIVRIAKNARPSALTGGNGVELEMQTLPGKDDLSTASIQIVTFTIWKGVDFSYMSSGAIPGKAVDKLTLASAGGKLSGSYESNLNGTLGKMNGKIEFGVPLPN